MKIALLLLSLLLSSDRLAAQRESHAAFISSYAKGHDFNGSILVQRRGRVVYEQSFGLANRNFAVPNANDTRYRIASITKAFTAVLVLQLRQEGRLDLAQTIARYLPDYAGEGATKVTIHQLLNHTSGIDNFDKVKSVEDAVANGMPNYQLPHTSDQLLARFASGPLVHAPGEVFDYNNADYIILGKIVERVTGQSFERALKARILEPLQLTNTGMLRQSDIVERLADTYFPREDLKALANDLPVFPENWYASGAMYSTTRDLLKFSNALFGARLLSPESLALMLTPGLDDYGYGVWSYESTFGGRKYRVVKRPGRIMGAQAQLYHIREADVTVILLSNTGTTDLDEFVAEIGRRLVGGE
jgi:D-alanyl-D-alanine carboxypeptidase